MSDFKISKRVVHSDTRSSILEKHDAKIKDIYSEIEKLDTYKQQLKNTKDSKKEIILKNKIENIENSSELNDYLFNVAIFLKEEESKETNLEEIKSSGIHKFVSINSSTNTGEIYDNFMEKCHGVTRLKTCKNNFTCKTCDSKTLKCISEGITTCYNCGDTEKLNLSMTPEWNSYENYEFIKPFSYKRSNHFKEWINQIQGREGTSIQVDILKLLICEIKKERINDKKLITYDKVKDYLKKLKLNKYYEHIPNIIHKLTGNRQLIISSELENKLVLMFDEIQKPFENNCPKNRKNFLSYSYTLYKFFQILQMEEYLIYFPLLKSREKLFEQEVIWKNICKELNWKFIRCI